MMKPRSFIVDISITSEEFIKLYQGRVRDAVVKARNGQVLRFPAEHLRPFLLHDGVHGSFKLSISAENKMLGLERLD